MYAPLVMAIVASTPSPTAQDWQTLANGVEHRPLKVIRSPKHGDGILHVVRIDPAKAKLEVRSASAMDGTNRTAGRWADSFKYVAVINAGMYETDFSTHTGYLRFGSHFNNKKWMGKYKSLLIIDPDQGARIEDALTIPHDIGRHRAAVQNLRLIAGPGRNVWTKNRRKWSEAAVAMDRKGRILFLFSRTPFSMWRFNEILLASDLQVTHAQHVEGGPEASLSVRGRGLQLDLSGSYETGFNENDRNQAQWKLPNVIAVGSR